MSFEWQRKRFDGFDGRRFHELVNFGLEFGAELVADASIRRRMEAVSAGSQSRLGRDKLLNFKAEILRKKTSEARLKLSQRFLLPFRLL